MWCINSFHIHVMVWEHASWFLFLFGYISPIKIVYMNSSAHRSGCSENAGIKLREYHDLMLPMTLREFIIVAGETLYYWRRQVVRFTHFICCSVAFIFKSCKLSKGLLTRPFVHFKLKHKTHTARENIPFLQGSGYKQDHCTLVYKWHVWGSN